MALPSAAVPILDSTLMHEKRSPVAEKVATSANIKTVLPDGVRVLAPHEYKEAAACLAEAFKSDHVVRYAIDTPDRLHMSEEERYALHTAGMEYVVYAHILQGLVLSVGENYDCVALWLPPGKNIDDWWTILRSGMWRMNYKLSAEGKIRFFDEFLPLLGRTKAETLGERDAKSWYLNYIGTKPSARGKGYARKLIEYVGDLADEQGLPCYLESSHDVNIIIYGKMGYELKRKIYLQRAAHELRLDVMVREPAAIREKAKSMAEIKLG